MKKLLFIIVIATKSLTMQSQIPASDQNQKLSQKQIEYAVKELNRTKDLIENELKGLSENQLNYKELTDKWSISEIVEHIALAENGIF